MPRSRTPAASPPAPRAPEPGSALRIDHPTKRPSVPERVQDDAAPLPHERDQAVGEVSEEPDPVIVQAQRDIEAGLVDTDMRATPGLDAERRARLVARPDAEAATRAADPVPGLPPRGPRRSG